MTPKRKEARRDSAYKNRDSRSEGKGRGSTETHSGVGASHLLLIGLCAVLVVATGFAYWPSLDNQLTNWDDPDYISHNPYIDDLSASNIGAIFTSFHKGNYHPLAMLSLAIDYAIDGENPGIYHRSSLALHIANVLLVFFLARHILQRGPPAFFVALVYGVHPLHVESVAWASARKDLVFALFFFASMLFYLRHCREAGGRANGRPGTSYSLALLCFILSLLSKGQAVALAPTLVAVDLFMKRRLTDRQVLVEKLPFFALALGFGVLAIVAQRESGGQLSGESYWLFSERIVFACYGYVRQLLMSVAPYGLTAFYPYPHYSAILNGLPAVYLIQVPIAMAVIGVFAWTRRRAPLLAFSIAFFTINIVLVLQLIPVGHAITADRYSYVPSFGIILALAAGGGFLLEKRPGMRVPIAFLALAYAAGLTAMTHQQSEIWYDSASLWDDVLEKYPLAGRPRINRAIHRLQLGDLAGAEADLDEMIELWPVDAKAYGHRAVIRYRSGRHESAISDINRAIELDPSAGLYSNRGSMHIAKGALGDALADFNKAIHLNPRFPEAVSKRGRTRGELGDYRGSLEDYRVLVELAPEWSEGYLGMAYAQLRLGRPKLAIQNLEYSIALAPSIADNYLYRGEAHMLEGRRQEACEDLQRAVKRGSKDSRSPLSRYCAGR